MAPKRRIARPAAAPAVLRRPAARVRGAPEKKLREIPIGDMHALGFVRLSKAKYYHREIDLVGEIKSARHEDGQTFLDLRATGTKDDEVLRVMTGRPDRNMVVHVCPDGCGAALTAENLVHGEVFTQIKPEEEAWYGNLNPVAGLRVETDDELARLRAAGELHENKGRDESPRRKEKGKKEKKEKSRKDADKKAAKKKEAAEPDVELEVGQKDLEALYAGTGLDPDVSKRRKVLKKARKIGQGKKKKKKKNESSSGSTSGGTTTEESTEVAGGVGLFDNEKKVKHIWIRCPGALTSTMIGEAKESLVTNSGSLWELKQAQLPPVACQYVRQALQGHMSAPMFQEALTLATITDLLLRGNPARASDVACQRLKSLEGTSRGQHWSIGRQLELARLDNYGIPRIPRTKRQPGWHERRRSSVLLCQSQWDPVPMNLHHMERDRKAARMQKMAKAPGKEGLMRGEVTRATQRKTIKEDGRRTRNKGELLSQSFRRCHCRKPKSAFIPNSWGK